MNCQQCKHNVNKCNMCGRGIDSIYQFFIMPVCLSINNQLGVGMENNLVKKIRRCRAVGVPLVSIETSDIAACCQALRESINGQAPMLSWDLSSGFRPLNDMGGESITVMLEGGDPSEYVSPDMALQVVAKMPADSILIMQSAHMWLADSLPSRQSLLNLRDSLKGNSRMIIFLSPSLEIPIELRNSIESFDEKLPDRDTIKGIAYEVLSSAELPINDDILNDTSEALVGLSAFAVEQCVALSLNPSGLDIDVCWERKKVQIEQTPGLSMQSPKIKFSDVGGLSAAKSYFSKLMKGPKAPRLLVRIEEVEKMVAGSGAQGDTSGVSQDFLQVMLDRIEENGWLGSLFLGPGGSGKSYASAAIGGEFSLRVIGFDSGAMKGSLVGMSEERVRTAFNTIEAIGGDSVLVVATCNGLQELRPELQRRLSSAGMWFYDLPDADEKRVIWDIQMRAYGVSGAIPNDEGWSSSDIRDCCRCAFLLGESLIDASKNINSAMNREPERIESLRRLAANRFSSASSPGAYKYQAKIQAAAVGRRIGGV